MYELWAVRSYKSEMHPQHGVHIVIGNKRQTVSVIEFPANSAVVAHLCDPGLFCRHGRDLICCEHETSTIQKITGPAVRLTHTNEKPCRHSLWVLLSEGMSWFKVSLTR